jgi:SM-20-related protein
MASNDHPDRADTPRLPLAEIVQALERTGWCVFDRVLDPAAVAALAANCRSLADGGAMHAARTGHGAPAAGAAAHRGDRIRWLAEGGDSDAEAGLVAGLDRLRAELNQRLYLGLADVEAHYACYAAGSGYGVHRDRFRDDDRRVVSLVLYLNPDWRDADGGALRLYLDAARSCHHDVAPLGGRLVCFLSADFEHEVLPATRERLSIAAWLRRRAGPA